MYRRLVLLVLVPSLALLVTATALASQARRDVDEANAVAHLAELAASAAALDAALGNETIGGADGFRSQTLFGLHAITNSRIGQFRKNAENSPTSTGDLETALAHVSVAIVNRDDITNGLITPLQIGDRYGRARAMLGQAIAREATLASPGGIPRDISTLLALVEASSAHVDERLGAGLAIHFSGWAPGQVSGVVSAIERQRLLLAGVAGATSGLDVAPTNGLEEARKKLLRSTITPEVTAEEWQRASDAWATQLGGTIDQYSSQVAAGAAAASARAERNFRLTVMAGGLVIIGAIGWALVIAFRLATRMARIGDAARQLALHPTGEERISDPYDDDLGDLARAFNAMADKIFASSERKRYESETLASIANRRPLPEIVASCNQLVLSQGCFEIDQRGESISFVNTAGVKTPLSSMTANRPNATGGDDLLLAVDLLWMASRRRRDLVDLERRANFDTLTGLPNRAKSIQSLEAMCEATNPQHPPAVLFLDLDGFKAINDGHGHDRGDAVLRAVARSAGKAIKNMPAFLGRIGGDEFVVLVPISQSLESIVRLAEELRSQVQAVETPPGLSLDVSIGIAFHAPGSSHLQTLSDADDAMYCAKRSTANIKISDEELRGQRVNRQDQEQLVLRTLINRDLEAHYQPIWDVQDECIVSLEALARPGAGFGPEGPASFFKAAERLGLASEFDKLMIEIVSRQVVEWIRHGQTPIPVSVNLSSQSLTSSRFAEEVKRILISSGCPFENIVLEVTEDGFIADLEAAAVHLGALREMGIRIAIDDFGSGYSSLAYLAGLPFDILKIDRLLISHLDGNSTNRSIVEMVIELGRILGVVVVAEGVERSEELGELSRIGCRLVQGFMLSRPLIASQVNELLANRSPADQNA